MTPLHSLLGRQLRRFYGTSAPEPMLPFIDAINQAYHQFDDDRRMLERSLDLSSSELIDKNTELRRNVSLLESTLESTADGIVVVNRDGKIVMYNRRFADMWRIPEDVLESRDDDRVITHVLGQLREPQKFIDKIRELGATPDAESVDQLEFLDGRIFERYSMPQRHDGQPVGRVWSFRDVTRAKEAESKLVHDAIHDGLTGLPNRVLFLDRLHYVIRRSKRQLASSFAVLFVDLDRFKIVNDSLGHLAGDELLVKIAQRLRQCVRPADTVARLGGDEFAILLDDVASPEDALAAARRIHAVLADPIRLWGTEFRPTASIGIAMSAPHYGRPHEVLRDADIAMYRAKGMGRSRHVLFQQGMHTTVVERMHLENELHRAVERGELVLHYQPIVRMADAHLVGFEALLRWNHPTRGLLLPAEFLHVIDEAGLTIQVGRWGLQEACTRLAHWQQRFNRPDLTMSVNLAPAHFSHPSVAEHVAEVLHRTRLSPHALALEITETTLMEKPEASANIQALRTLGVGIRLDDFGTGYSSLSYLHSFPVDTLKIDRTFVMNMGTGRNLEIVRTIIKLAQGLDMKVVAEGVETEDQRTRLLALGCTIAQGFYFSAAADDSAVQTMIVSGLPVPPPVDAPLSLVRSKETAAVA